MVANHVDDGNVRSAGVVEIGQTVTETGSEVEQRDGRLSGDTGVAIGGTSNDTLEESKDPAHAGL